MAPLYLFLHGRMDQDLNQHHQHRLSIENGVGALQTQKAVDGTMLPQFY